MNKKLKVLWLSIASIVSGILYRLGGTKGFNTKLRDLGCATVGWLTIVFIVGITCPWYIHLLSFLLLFGALTTYWDSIFGYDNFYFHGFMLGLAYFPYAIITHSWVGFLIRCAILSISIGGLNYLVNKYKVPWRDYIEELFRGAVIILTLLIL